MERHYKLKGLTPDNPHSVTAAQMERHYNLKVLTPLDYGDLMTVKMERHYKLKALTPAWQNGNLQRSSAISTICNHSDCTVAYTVAEFKVLSNWIKSVL